MPEILRPTTIEPVIPLEPKDALEFVSLYSGHDIRLYDPRKDADRMPRTFWDQPTVVSYMRTGMAAYRAGNNNEELPIEVAEERRCNAAKLATQAQIVGALCYCAMLSYGELDGLRIVAPREKTEMSTVVKVGRRVEDGSEKPFSDPTAGAFIAGVAEAADPLVAAWLKQRVDTQVLGRLAHARSWLNSPAVDSHGKNTIEPLGNAHSAKDVGGSQARLAVVIDEELVLTELQGYREDQYVSNLGNRWAYETARSRTAYESFLAYAAKHAGRLALAGT